MRFFLYILFLFSPFIVMTQQMDYIKLSQDLLYAVKTDEDFTAMRKQLADAGPDELVRQLSDENKRKAFWLNIYNAYTQIGLKENPDAYKKRNRFFSKEFIRVAGKDLSLDGVEHGIIRRSKWKYSLGHFNKLFKSRFEKQFRLEKVDYRIHFALNCGAKSCPPIAFYKPEQMDKQLDLAAKVYLKNEVLYDAEEHTIEVPAIFSWFRGDFGGKKGIRKILKEQQLIPADSDPRIKWKKYDWTLALKNYETF